MLCAGRLSDGGEAVQLFDGQREALGIRDKYPASGLRLQASGLRRDSGKKMGFGIRESGFGIR
jgi:hypothetical protein